jgi:hypothetical protein
MVEQYGKWAWIKHDKDVHDKEITDKDGNVVIAVGDLKDAHYHIYLEFPNPRSLNSIAKELGIEPNMVEVVRDKRGLLDYLTHRRSPEKWQYTDEELHANFEIQRLEEPLTMIVVYKLLTECDSFEKFISELTHRGLSGNPLINYSNCKAVWKNHVKRGDDDEEDG